MAAAPNPRARQATNRHGFDFTFHIGRLCADIVERLPHLAHIDVAQVAFGFAQTRKAVSYGLQATVTPMRFEAGSLTIKRFGQIYTLQRLFGPSGIEILYIVTFYLPRYLCLPFDEKLATLFHELWHISPRFDGDLRRHAGRCYAHGRSQKEFDQRAHQLARHYLERNPPQHVYAFLNTDFRQLIRRHRRIYGLRIPTPKLIPVDANASRVDRRLA